MEPRVAKTIMEVTEDNEETAIVLEKEIEFEIIESRSKIDKRKNDESGQHEKETRLVYYYVTAK